MKPLIKIRIKYFKRHLCSFIFGYILIPAVLFIYFVEKMIAYIGTKYSVNSEFLFKNSFTNLASILKKTYLISENIEDRIKLQKFIYKETKINITTYSSESEIFNKSYNILIMTNIDNKYNFIFPELNKEENYDSFLEYQSLISKFQYLKKQKQIQIKIFI